MTELEAALTYAPFSPTRDEPLEPAEALMHRREDSRASTREPRCASTLRTTLPLLTAVLLVSCGGSSSSGPYLTLGPGETHPRVVIRNGCATETMWIQWQNSANNVGGALSGPNRQAVAPGGSVTYDIPDKGLASMRWWPGYGCDANGQNCRVGASGGSASLGFTCPAKGCAPAVDSKFEATFGCMPGVAQCQTNPSDPGHALGNADSWDASAVDGYTSGVKVKVNGSCPGGPSGGVIDCLALGMSGCPTTEDLSSGGTYPSLTSVDLRVVNPAASGYVGCYSPVGKLTFDNWGNGPTYAPADPHANAYACATLSSTQCTQGVASKTKYHDYIHSICNNYAYAYDDGFGGFNCPASASTTYDVTFGCSPQ